MIALALGVPVFDHREAGQSTVLALKDGESAPSEAAWSS
ncbi:hypothetical protein EYZ11_013026 [Aspergillus tanneri]|uniref:Uncharacterized protein n=1 Tax=Aspergillus tanneri TaxID=1220188 RepID=A0A4S3J0W1_9EURO|nr:hypothetical protein EYZ11_013026 [Aspergillus tanneri]